MNKKQIGILIDYFINSEIMRAAVRNVMINGATAYASGVKYGVSRAAISRQVRLMNDRSVVISEFNSASDVVDGF